MWAQWDLRPHIADAHRAVQDYLKNSNLLTEQLAEMREKGRIGVANPAYAELVRRLGFEYWGTVLHEDCHGNSVPKGRGEPSRSPRHTLEQSVGDCDAWKVDFTAVGSLRGVGQPFCMRIQRQAALDHWTTLRQQGGHSGFKAPCGDGRVGARLSCGLHSGRA